MAKGKALLKPPTAAGARSSVPKKQRPAWQGLLEWAKANPGATVAALLSAAFVVVIGVWSPLGPEQFARVRGGGTVWVWSGM